MLFQGASMYYVGMGEQLSRPLMWDGNALEFFMDRWRPVDPKSDPYDPSNEWISGDFAYGAFTPDDNSEFRMQEGSYVRLKNIELGYTIPKQILNKININKASAPELEKLPGIGPAIAERIVRYREENGTFKSIEDLQNVSGIGTKKYSDLKELITIN